MNFDFNIGQTQLGHLGNLFIPEAAIGSQGEHLPIHRVQCFHGLHNPVVFFLDDDGLQLILSIVRPFLCNRQMVLFSAMAVNGDIAANRKQQSGVRRLFAVPLPIAQVAFLKGIRSTVFVTGQANQKIEKPRLSFVEKMLKIIQSISRFRKPGSPQSSIFTIFYIKRSCHAMVTKKMKGGQWVVRNNGLYYEYMDFATTTDNTPC